MKQYLHGMLVGAVSLASVLAPLSSANAARNFIQMQELQKAQEMLEQRNQDAEELLELLQLSLDKNDPVLDTQEFQRVIDEYQEFKISIGHLGTAYIETIDQMLELMLLATEVQHPDFADLLPTEADIESIEQARDELLNNSENFEEEFTQFVIETMISELSYSYNDEYYYDEYEYPTQDLWAWGYADPWNAQPGQIVWLKNDSDNPAGTEVSVTWTQTGGPEVLWLQTDHPTDTLFIAPQLLEGEEFMSLRFEMMVENGIETDYHTVWVDVAEEGYWEWEDSYEDYDEEFMLMAQAVDPNDPAVQGILELLWLDLPEDSTLYQDPNFEAFVNAYIEFEASGLQLMEGFIDVFDGIFDIAIAASEVNHEAFQESFGLTESDKQEIQEMRMELRDQLLQEGENIGEMLFFLLFAFTDFTEL